MIVREKEIKYVNYACIKINFQRVILHVNWQNIKKIIVNNFFKLQESRDNFPKRNLKKKKI